MVWVPKYRKEILVGEVAIRTREIIRSIAFEHELQIISGKVAKDHIHIFFSHRPTQSVSKLAQYLKGTSSRIILNEFPHLKKNFWGKHLWARGFLAISSGNITDEVIKKYIDSQIGEQLADDSRFQIDNL